MVLSAFFAVADAAALLEVVVAPVVVVGVWRTDRASPLPQISLEFPAQGIEQETVADQGAVCEQ